MQVDMTCKLIKNHKLIRAGDFTKNYKFINYC